MLKTLVFWQMARHSDNHDNELAIVGPGGVTDKSRGHPC